jgi:hypothetical protein
VNVGRPRRAVLLGAAWFIGAAPALKAQVTGSLEAAVSRVHYDDFLPSAAASLGGAVAVQAPSAALRGRASYLLFETGNSTWQAALAGAYFTSRIGPARPELWAAAGGSRYAYFPSFWHAIAGARFHFGIEQGTVWLDGSVGRTAFGAPTRPLAIVGAGVWTRRYGPTVTLATSYVRVGDTTYSDLQAAARGRPGSVEVDGVLGARLWSRGGGRGVYAEATVAVPLGSATALVLAGGRYPTDPTRGTISGNYMSAGLRVRMPAPGQRPAPRTPEPLVTTSGPGSSEETGAEVQLQVRREKDGAVRIIVRAPTATHVELAGDFTDWQPLAMTPAGPGRWEVGVRIAPGVHHINVRLNRGPWFAPGGTARSSDDYGGEIGIVVVP